MDKDAKRRVPSSASSFALGLKPNLEMESVKLAARLLEHEGFCERDLLEWVACGRARIVGGASIGGVVFVSEFDDFDYIQCLCVIAARRSQGIGRALINKSLRAGCVAWAKVHKDNTAALRAFAKAGCAQEHDVPSALTSVIGTDYIAVACDRRESYDLGVYDMYHECCELQDRIQHGFKRTSAKSARVRPRLW